MSRDVYMFDVSHTDDAKLLQSIRKEVLADDLLSLLECAEILGAVDKRFAWLNARAVGNQKPRW